MSNERSSVPVILRRQPKDLIPKQTQILRFTQDDGRQMVVYLF